MDNFIKIEINNTEYVINTNQITQTSYYNNTNKGRIYFADRNWIDISRDDYNKIKAKLIDND